MKRERIITAAVRLWRETHNVNKVSLEDIAGEAGVSPTTIYNNFGTRDGLLKEVVKHLTGEMLNKQWAALESDLPFPLKMQAMLSLKMATKQDMQTELLDKFSTDSVVGQYLDEVYETEMRPMMTAIIGEGKRQGYISPDLPDDVIMLYLNIMKTGSTAYATELRHVAEDSRLLTALTHVFYYGLFQKEFDFAVNFDANKEAR